jgi:hypothetical protein
MRMAAAAPEEAVEPGQWYLTIHCKACRKWSSVAHDRDAKLASGGITLTLRDGWVLIRCGACGVACLYSRPELKSIQADGSIVIWPGAQDLH